MPAVFQTNAVGHGSVDQLCPIPTDKIDSTILLATPSSKQIVFCLDQGQELADHQAPYVATIHVLDGAVAVHIDDDSLNESYSLESGGVVVIPSRVTHSVKAIQPTRMLLTLVKDSI